MFYHRHSLTLIAVKLKLSDKVTVDFEQSQTYKDCFLAQIEMTMSYICHTSSKRKGQTLASQCLRFS